MPYWRLSALYFAYFAFVGAFAPYFGLYLESIGQSAWHIGLLFAEMQLVRVIAPNLWAALADARGSREALLRGALLLAAVSWCALFATRSFAGLAIALAVVAFFTSAAMPLVESSTIGHLRSDLGRYGAIRMWGSIGFIVMVLATGALLDRFPLSVLLPVVLGTLAGAFIAAVGVPDSRHRPIGPREPLGPVLRRPHVAWFLAACFLMSVAHGPLYTFYSIHLADHGYAKSVVGLMWTIGVLAEILVFIAMPAWLGRFGAGPVLTGSFAAAVIRFAVIGWAVGSVELLAAAQILHGATFGAYHAASLAIVNRWFSGGRQVRGQALYLSASFGAGGMTGGLLSGLAWDGVGPAWTFSAASIVAGAGLAIAIVVQRSLGRESSSAAA